MNLTSSQRSALAQLQARLGGHDLRPTYALAGPSGSGKSTVARLLGGEYHNFTLEWLDEFFAARSPLFLQAAALTEFLLAKVAAATSPLVVVDGLESALVGLVPARRQEIGAVLHSLMRQSTGHQLVLVISAEAGSPFLTPGFADRWPERDKVIPLAFIADDARDAAALLGAIPELAESATSFYDLIHVASQGKE